MPTYRIQLLDRDDRAFEIEAGETILAAAERQDVTLMAGCRAGACLTCAARMVKGRVHMPPGTALTPEMVEAHVVLPCIATVSANTELIVGRPGRTLLHPRHIRPWTD